MTFEKTEGIILHVLNYQDYDQILTVFTKDCGVFKLFAKGFRNPKKKMGALISPMAQAEFVFSRGNSELLKCREISFLNAFHHLRQDYDLLSAGCQFLRAIIDSQLPEKPAHQLYQLLLYYLNHLPEVDPKVLVTSFKLKILRFEGLLSPSVKLAQFSDEENKYVTLLAFCQKLSQIREIELPLGFEEKINGFFLSNTTP